jgi:SAM-dependent methyltransferase
MAWVAERVATIDLEGLDVLEVGSYDVNGSVRELFAGARSYLGIDSRPGPGVDHVFDIETFQDGPDLGTRRTWDVIVSTEMLEHTPNPAAAIAGIARVSHPGSHLILTTRSPGFPRHDEPQDFHRFTIAQVVGLTEHGWRCLVAQADPLMPGVFYHGRKL